MRAQNVSELFRDTPWQAEGSLFSEADLRKTASLAGADSINATTDLVERLLAGARERLLDIPLVDILLGGWLRLRAVQAYASEERRGSDTTYEHELAKHRLTSEHSPRVELHVHDVKLAEVEFDLQLSIVIARAKLLIRRGRIMEIAVSGASTRATLKYGKHTLLTREAEELDFPLTLPLGEGIEIPPPLQLADMLGDADRADS
jgi:hypothetical protein